MAPVDDDLVGDATRAAADLDRFLHEQGLRRRTEILTDADLDQIGAEAPGDPRSDAERLAESQRFQRALYDAGLAWLDGPRQYGGRELERADAALLRGLLAEHELPDQSFFTVTWRIVAPTILAHGTKEQRDDHLGAFYRGDLLACQMFSEPEAGSDLAGLRCQAVRDGDEWVLTGQKIWSSWAHLSQVGEILARTGPLAERHRSITAFLLDLSAPGITVRPIRQMNGGSHFNEVFLDEVRIPDSARLGAVGGGWGVAMNTLASERAAMGARDKNYLSRPYDRLRRLAPAVDVDPRAQELLAEAWIREQVAKTTADRVADPAVALSPSVGKLALVEDLSFYARTAAELLGPDLVLDSEEPGRFAWSQFVLGYQAQRIAGGSDQVQRTIVAERVLGLPREPRYPKESRP